jgi:hypothetical protein
VVPWFREVKEGMAFKLKERNIRRHRLVKVGGK